MIGDLIEEKDLLDNDVVMVGQIMPVIGVLCLLSQPEFRRWRSASIIDQAFFQPSVAVVQRSRRILQLPVCKISLRHRTSACQAGRTKGVYLTGVRQPSKPWRGTGRQL